MKEIIVSYFQMMVKTMLLSKFGVDERFFAHTSSKYKSETLIEHSNLTLEYFEKIVKVKNLDSLIDKLIKQIDYKNFTLIKEMFKNAVYLHDLGKINPCFQAKKMSNPLFKEYEDCGDSNHSKGGALSFINYYKPKIELYENDIEYFRLIYILYNFSYHIDKHHGRLNSIEEYFERDTIEHADFNNAKKNVERYLNNKFEFYILNKLLFSLLVSSDYYATSEYMTKLKTDDFGLFSQDEKIKLRDKFDAFKNGFPQAVGINKLRDEMFEEAQINLLKNLDKNIFYLEAPTGSGKTINSINLALELLQNDKNLNKLFYVFPFNTLVEQTKNVFDEIFKDELRIEIVNSITPLNVINQEDEETKYINAYINRLFFHSPAIITTHVSLFNILFGTSKEDNFPLWQLANSVIILDEIQSYNNHLWWYMVDFFDKYAQLLNIKIIIMSATLPKLDYFLEQKNNFVDLISKEKRDYFFQNKLFKNRVDVDFSYVNEKMDFEKLVEILESKIKTGQKFLFEFIKKQSAREFYNIVKEKYENVYELSGDDNKAYRQYVINKSKEDDFIIIIATQVIEAGVDIDMDVGFKDISTLDGEEQFMGRINRSCTKSGSKVYFFDMDDVEKIYRNDNRLGFDIKQEKYKLILQNKEFGEYYKEVLEVIHTKGLRYNNGLLTNYDHFTELLKKLNYKEIAKTMILINSQNFTLYFPFKIEISKYNGVKEFKDIDAIYLSNGMLDGQKVWDEFRSLSEIKNFTKMEFEKSKINSLMQFFTFNILKFNENQKLPYFSYEFGGYYFVQNYEEFIQDGKFDRAKYIAKKDEMFL